MSYQIDIRIEYPGDVFHNESVPDGPALVEQMQNDFDAVMDNASELVKVLLLREEEMPNK